MSGFVTVADIAAMPGIPPPCTGGVYALCGAPGWVKIGQSKNIAERMRQLQPGHPEPLKLVAILSTDTRLEEVWHMRWRHQRAHGEWFRLTEEMARAILSGSAPYADLQRLNGARVRRRLRGAEATS